MAELTLRINGYPYTVACEDGQEPHLRAMGQALEDRVESIKALGTQSGESKLLVLAGLLMADELHDLRAELADAQRQQPTRAGKTNRQFAQTISRLADRAEQIATALEQP
jgi:cell division protein ZapA